MNNLQRRIHFRTPGVVRNPQIRASGVATTPKSLEIRAPGVATTPKSLEIRAPGVATTPKSLETRALGVATTPKSLEMRAPVAITPEARELQKKSEKLSVIGYRNKCKEFVFQTGTKIPAKKYLRFALRDLEAQGYTEQHLSIRYQIFQGLDEYGENNAFRANIFIFAEKRVIDVKPCPWKWYRLHERWKLYCLSAPGKIKPDCPRKNISLKRGFDYEIRFYSPSGMLKNVDRVTGRPLLRNERVFLTHLIENPDNYPSFRRGNWQLDRKKILDFLNRFEKTNGPVLRFIKQKQNTMKRPHRRRRDAIRLGQRKEIEAEIEEFTEGTNRLDL